MLLFVCLCNCCCSFAVRVVDVPPDADAVIAVFADVALFEASKHIKTLLPFCYYCHHLSRRHHYHYHLHHYHLYYHHHPHHHYHYLLRHLITVIDVFIF